MSSKLVRLNSISTNVFGVFKMFYNVNNCAIDTIIKLFKHNFVMLSVITFVYINKVSFTQLRWFTNSLRFNYYNAL